MEKSTLTIPGYEGVDANWIRDTMNRVHDIAQELAYMGKVDLSALDKINRSYVTQAFYFARRRAEEQLFNIMLEIRKSRTPIN